MDSASRGLNLPTEGTAAASVCATSRHRTATVRLKDCMLKFELLMFPVESFINLLNRGVGKQEKVSYELR